MRSRRRHTCSPDGTYTDRDYYVRASSRPNVILRYSEGSALRDSTARSFGIPQDDKARVLITVRIAVVQRSTSASLPKHADEASHVDTVACRRACDARPPHPSFSFGIGIPLCHA